MYPNWSAAEFACALDHIRLTDNNRRILQAFLDAPEHTLTAHSLARAAALKGGRTAANLRIGELARKFAPLLGPLPDEGDGNPHWWRYIAAGKWRDGHFHWTLRPSLKVALLTNGWEEAASHESGEIPLLVAQTYREGSLRQIQVNAYERNPAARAACINYFGTACQICETDLVDIYGDVARGYIQVHHLRPLRRVLSGQSPD
ncbi:MULTISPECIES: HNH endonuclease [Deinococcus]|uniref:HNH endonuclease n=1 Tax=Deinococcus TaxID=1298 RepID=UPI00145CC6BB|nr:MULTISPECIES: hypothetical protein [Deinococcus]MCY1702453.1 hypothetical protein [Deinococcus sp. SL84]